jgi:hypothetical protein
MTIPSWQGMLKSQGKGVEVFCFRYMAKANELKYLFQINELYRDKDRATTCLRENTANTFQQMFSLYSTMNNRHSIFYSKVSTMH